jgi:hypothetical protein
MDLVVLSACIKQDQPAGRNHLHAHLAGISQPKAVVLFFVIKKMPGVGGARPAI